MKQHKKASLREKIKTDNFYHTPKQPYDKNQIKITDPVSYFQNFFKPSPLLCRTGI